MAFNLFLNKNKNKNKNKNNNIMLPLMTLTFILLHILLYVLILVISTCVLVFTNSNITHLFLSLDLRKNLILLTMFARPTCLVYYIGCQVSYTWAIQLMRAQTSSMYNRLFILLIQVGYLCIDISPTSLPQRSTLLFLLIFIMYKHITPNAIYYHSHTFFLMIYNFSIIYTAWCLTLYHNPIYCWALSIYNYFNLLPILL